MMEKKYPLEVVRMDSGCAAYPLLEREFNQMKQFLLQLSETKKEDGTAHSDHSDRIKALKKSMESLEKQISDTSKEILKKTKKGVNNVVEKLKSYWKA